MNSISDLSLLFSAGAAFLGIIYAVWASRQIASVKVTNEKMLAIAQAIKEGSEAYLKREYSVILVVALVLFVILFLALGLTTAVGFAIGAFASALAGALGMMVAVRTNVKTAHVAKNGLAAALDMAFRGGSVTGLLVAALALLSITAYYYILVYLLTTPLEETLKSLVALGFGGSLISVFARLGGGIYTKGADVGTDMVGKIEKNIPEDDPRNPGVIADQVGDNVGDCAGMAADLFETYVVTIVATMILAFLLFSENIGVILYPLQIGALSLFCSLAGIFAVKLGKGKNAKIMQALYKGLAVSTILSVVLFYPLTKLVFENSGLAFFPVYLSSLLGIAVTVLMIILTEYYTSKNFSPVRKIAQASETGHGTNIIAGLAVSMKSTFFPVLLIVVAMLTAYYFAGLFGVAVAAVAMLSQTGIVVAIDSFGPITDNAGGIAEMSGQPKEVREVTDALDAVGNTTKAITKGYAIASAGLAALVLFASYTQELSINTALNLDFSLSDPFVLSGLLLGASLPYIFAALSMESVGIAGMAVVTEVRRQFKEIKGIMEGKNKPDYAACVDIVTKTALRQMMLPALIPVVAPLLVGLILGPKALGGLLVGTIVTGLFVAISMTTGGAAWDNAKKYIEEGKLGGKGSFAHQAAVTGDTVGDPYKDTAGPAINPMIKIINIVALLLAPFLVMMAR
ncbi:sodium-translocating pyrophosphatase [Candidatus Microgenomates bacterium]|nr:sodium-translocating pyrophosphatase [Candidatus Microgenomates bacterium]